MDKRRVVVTGIGAVTPIGNDAETSWENAKKGVNGVAKMTRLNPDDFPVKIAAELKDFDVEKYLEKKLVKWTVLRIMQLQVLKWPCKTLV